jgi:outer membrane murein-binding lipoprotein Lpp
VPRRLPTALVVSVLLALTVAPAASANAFEDLYKEYASTGKIDPCKTSAEDLRKAQRQVPNDIDQYAPDFPAALEVAAEARASGACAKTPASTTTTAAAAAPTATPATPGAAPAQTTPSAPAATTTTTAAPAPGSTQPTPQPAPDPSPSPAAGDDAIGQAVARAPADTGSDGPPAPLVVLAVLGGLLALGALVYGAASWWAWDPAWWRRGRHASAEAAWRTSATWSDFADWVRPRR